MARHYMHCGTHNGEACDCASDYDCSPEDCDCRAPSVPDPIADTARALARLWNEERAHREANRPNMPGARKYSHDAACHRMVAIRAAAQVIGPQVYAAFCALVTGDAGRAPEGKA